MDSPDEIPIKGGARNGLRGLSLRQVEEALLRLTIAAYVAFNLGKHGIYRPLTIDGVDYPKHWLAARAVLQGQNIYNPDDWHLWLGFNYPQWSAMITLWLAWLDRGVGQIVWKAMLLGAIIAAWWVASRLLHPMQTARAGAAHSSFQPPLGSGSGVRDNVAAGICNHWGLACAALIAAFSPAGASPLFPGNIEPFNTFFVMAFAGALFARMPRMAGVYWAMLCLVKMVPVALIFPILLWRQWRIMQGWLAFMAVYFVMLVLTGRLGFEWFFVSEMMELIPLKWRWISIGIPQAFLVLLFPRALFSDPEIFNRVMAVYLAIVVTIYPAALWMLYRRGLSFTRALEFGIVFVPLLSPLLEGQHFSWTLPVLFMQVGRWVRGEIPSPTAAVLALGWAITCLDHFHYNYLLHFGTFGYFLTLWGILLVVATTFYDSIRRGGQRSAIGHQLSA